MFDAVDLFLVPVTTADELPPPLPELAFHSMKRLFPVAKKNLLYSCYVWVLFKVDSTGLKINTLVYWAILQTFFMRMFIRKKKGQKCMKFQ